MLGGKLSRITSCPALPVEPSAGLGTRDPGSAPPWVTDTGWGGCWVGLGCGSLNPSRNPVFLFVRGIWGSRSPGQQSPRLLLLGWVKTVFGEKAIPMEKKGQCGGGNSFDSMGIFVGKM